MKPPRRDLIGLPPDSPKERKPGSGLTKTGALARPKSGGRTKGTRNKLEISAEMTDDILSVYAKLGGPRWLLSWAKAHETEFVKQALSRLFPTPPRDLEVEISNTVNIDPMSDFEVARRIAFALASGAEAQKRMLAEQGATIEAETKPVSAQPDRLPWISPLDKPPEGRISDLALQELVQQQRKQQANALIADTLGGPNDYHGSAAEQGRGRRRKLI